MHVIELPSYGLDPRSSLLLELKEFLKWKSQKLDSSNGPSVFHCIFHIFVQFILQFYSLGWSYTTDGWQNSTNMIGDSNPNDDITTMT